MLRLILALSRQLAVICMKTSILTLGLLILFSCGNDSARPDTSTTVNPSLVSEADYLRTRDRTIQYLKDHMYSGGQYKGDDDALLKLENDSITLLENQLRQIFTNSRISNLPKDGKLNLEALSEGLGFGLLDGLNVKDGRRTTFCTSRSLFVKYFGKDTASKLENLDPAVLQGMFQSALYSEVRVTNFSTIKLDSPKGTTAYGMVASVAQDIGAFLPHLLLVFFADANYVYIVEEPIEVEFKEIKTCKAVWDSLSSVSEAQLKKYRESNLQDTAAFASRIDLEQKAWNDYCACYLEKLSKDGQFNSMQLQMDKILKGLQ